MHEYTDYISINYLHDLPEDKALIQTKSLSIGPSSGHNSFKAINFFSLYIIQLSSNYVALGQVGYKRKMFVLFFITALFIRLSRNSYKYCNFRYKYGAMPMVIYFIDSTLINNSTLK